MSIARRLMILALAVALGALAMLVGLRAEAHVGWSLWPLHLGAGFAIVAAVFSDRTTGRRLLLTLALLLSLGVIEVQSLHLLMYYEDWLQAGMPDKPGAVQLLPLLLGQLDRIVRFGWADGLSGKSMTAVLPGAIVALVTLVGQAGHSVLPASIRRLANIGAGLWLMVLCLFIGRWILAASGVPTLVLVLGALLLPWGLGGGSKWMLGLLWGACVAAVFVVAANWIWDAGRLLDLLCATAIVTTLICWAVWYWFMNDIVEHEINQPKPQPAPPSQFDLIEHLDSPEAQEGADKYTRE
jgi:hypothetical protein